MVVDDSAVLRGLTKRWIDAEPDMEVVASASNGAQALKELAGAHCDVIVLDIEMPVMDGITALPQLIQADPSVRVIMSSTLTRRNASITLKALSMGAADCIAKPEASKGIAAATAFRDELVTKVRGLAPSAGRARRKADPAPRATSPAPAPRAAATGPITLRPTGARAERPAILCIGSSTGGPNALLRVLADCKAALSVPVVITQHMPAMFTAILAEHLASATGHPCAEARQGEGLVPGHIYVAPGDFHMRLVRMGEGVSIALDQGPRINFCRPSVDPLFQSVASIYGARTLAVMLTGMGADGCGGTRAIAEAHGTVIAQDEASSVVWGMPGAVAQAGLANKVLPLPQIGPEIAAVMRGGVR
ncbi:MAG: chemotaxis response regulator protein-glutamate methylesterase [Alphaproteobacteria bacterium]|nr:chemotaxis response regulator protein-glutamate methylesterase [Alphaproteobacteria bacterium]